MPPREGFGPLAVGAIGLLVHRLAAPEDVVIGEAAKGEVFPGRRFLPVGRPLWPVFGRAARYEAGVAKMLRKLRPALIEVHNRAGIAAGLACRFPAARVLLFVHNDPQAMRGAKSFRERTEILQRVHVVCVSDYLAGRFMEGVTWAGRRPDVLPNALALHELPPRLPAADREPLILFAGRMVADKGADAFVRACAAVLPNLPGWRAAMIGADRFWAGSRQTPFERKLAVQAAEAGITLRGYLPHEDVLRAMARAAIVVVPSRWAEPFGLTALEALASGAALISSGRGGLREVAGEAALIADPDAPGELEAAILRLATDADLRGGLAKAGLARAHEFDAGKARLRLAELRQAALRT